MRALVLVASFALAAPAFALDLVEPRSDGLVLGTTLHVEVADADSPPSCALDGVAVTTTWRPLAKKRHWVADVKLGASGKHTLEVAWSGAKASATVTTIRFAHEAADLVEQRALAQKPLGDRDWQWGPAVLTYGLAKYAPTSADHATIVKALDDYYAAHVTKLPKIDHPDLCAPALGALELARHENVSSGLPGAKAVADYLKTEQRNALGAIDHLGAHGTLRFLASLFPITKHWAHSIWVDSLVMYSVFATQWGSSTNDAALRDFGAAQPGIFAAKLQDPVTGLCTHAWDVPHRRALGAKWARGNGWVGVATVEILDELPASHPKRVELESVLTDLAKGLVAKQQANGLWDTLVDTPGAGYSESSGSALAAYALAKGARLGVLPQSMRANARRTFEALTARLKRTPDGLAVTGTSTATNPYPEVLYAWIPVKDDVDYGIGAYLLLASELANESWP